MLQSERRQFPRAFLPLPIRAFVGAVPVQVADVSVSGLRVKHQSSLPAPRSACRIMFQSEFGPVTVDCEVVYTAGHENAFHTGLRVLAADRQSEQRLRQMINDLFASQTRRKPPADN
jgi:hypothetical protein